MSELAKKECIPCRGGIPPLSGNAIKGFLDQINSDWKVINAHHLEREFVFADFKEALGFTNKVGALAEAQGHHPDITLAWGKVRITLWTHKIDGLAESDFILAAKIDEL